MGACNEKHTPTFSHLELEVEGLDLSDLDMGENEGPHGPDPSSPKNAYTVSLSIAKGAVNDKLASVLGSFPDKEARLFYRPAGVVAARPFRERVQQRLGADLAKVLEGAVPANTTWQAAAPV